MNEKAICVVCKRGFIRRIKKYWSGHHGGTDRPFKSVTCSKLCSAENSYRRSKEASKIWHHNKRNERKSALLLMRKSR